MLKNRRQLKADFVKAQRNRCALCGTGITARTKAPGDRSALDHNHITGAYRGVLCGSCNVGLGNFCDSPELLQKAIDYLKRTDARIPRFPRFNRKGMCDGISIERRVAAIKNLKKASMVPFRMTEKRLCASRRNASIARKAMLLVHGKGMPISSRKLRACQANAKLAHIATRSKYAKRFPRMIRFPRLEEQIGRTS